MSTYTKYQVFTKENLSRIRNPGNASDGICEQRVIFKNDDNIYYGTFVGKVNPTNSTFNDATINGGTINDAELRNVTIKAGTETISIVDLTSNVSDLSTKFETFTNETFPDAISTLEEKIEKAATSTVLDEISTAIVASVDNTFSALTGLSDEIDALSDDIYKTFDYLSDVISSQVSDDIQDLSTKSGILSNDVYDISNDVNDLSNWSNDISSYADNISSYADGISTNVSNLSIEFQDHVSENISSFNELTKRMLSTVQNDKHYSLYANITSSYPYEAKDFMVNVIEDSTKDVKFIYNGIVIGYGVYGDNHATLNVALFDMDKAQMTPNVPESWQNVLENGISKTIGTNGYQITWSYSSHLNSLVISTNVQSLIPLYGEGNFPVGNITDYLSSADGDGLISGIMHLNRYDKEYPKYGIFYDVFGPDIAFDRDSHRRVISTLEGQEGVSSYMIEFEGAHNYSFYFATDVSSVSYTSIQDSNGVEFGRILSGNVDVADNQVDSIKMTQIMLSGYGGIPYATSVELDASSGLSGQIAHDIFVSCDAIAEDGKCSASFDVVSSLQYLNYNCYPASSSSPKAIVMPDVANELILDGNFDVVSVKIDLPPWPEITSIWQSTYELHKTGSIWSFTSDDPANPIGLSCYYDENVDLVVELSGYSADVGGVSYYAKYDVDVDNPTIDNERSSSSSMFKSSMIAIDFLSSDIYPGPYSEIVCGEPQPQNPQTYSIESYELNDSTGIGTIAIKVPDVESEYSYDYMREFIATLNIKTDQYDKLCIKLLSSDNSEIVMLNNGYEDDATIPANEWTAVHILETRKNVWSIDKISHKEIFSHLSALDDQVEYLSNDIQDLWKNVRGGLNFMGVLTATENVAELSTFLTANFAILYPDIPAATIKVRQGFFYPIHGENTLSHYNIGGLEIEHGDWLIAKDNFIVSAATSNDMTVFDAQDADVVRLGSDNTFTGINIFENKAIFNNISANAISVDSSTFVIDEANTLKDLSDDLYGKTSKNANDIESISNIIDAKTYLGSVVSEATELPTLASWFESLASVNPDTMLYKGAFARSNVKVESISSSTSSDVGFIGVNDYLIINKDIVASSINWSDVDVIRDPKNEAIDISTDLSTLRQRVDNAELSIDGLSNVVSVLSYQCMHYRGDLSGDGDDTLSGWLQHTYGQLPGLKITVGSMHRVNDLSITCLDAFGNNVSLFKNDYIIFKHDVEISEAALSDFDIIHDAMAESLDLSSQMVANDAYLSNAIDSKIFIDGLSTESLSAIHINQEEFYQKVNADQILSNELYIVSSEYINAYGQQIKNLSAPADLSDATTKEYVDNNDAYISSWISSNFANTGSNAWHPTTFNYDVSVLNDAYIVNNLSIGGSLSVNGVQFGITTKISDDISTTVAETVADEINLSTLSGDTSLCVTNNYITFTTQSTNITTQSFNISHDETKIINATSSNVKILSVINVETSSATITTLSSGQLSVYSSYINELSTNALSSNSIIVPFDNIKDATTLCSISDLSNALSNQMTSEISGLRQQIYNALKPVDEKLSGITISSNTQTMFSALVDVISILSNLKEAIDPRS